MDRSITAVICHGGYIEPETVEACLNLYSPWNIRWHMLYGYDIARSRNRAVSLAWSTSHLLMVDSDVIPEPNALCLLAQLKADVAVAPIRNAENQWELFTSTERITDLPTAQEPFTAHSASLAFALLDMRPLRKSAQPWFAYTAAQSEDHYFCDTRTVWIEPRARVQHIKRTKY